MNRREFSRLLAMVALVPHWEILPMQPSVQVSSAQVTIEMDQSYGSGVYGAGPYSAQPPTETVYLPLVIQDKE